MQHVRALILCLLSASLATAYPRNQAPAVAVSAQASPVIAQLEQAAQATSSDLARLRIEKWKTDGGTKQQAQGNAESLQRNLSSALPALLSQARASPNDATALFRLYRNIGALYDVLSNVAEATGAFGPKQDYEALARRVDQFDQSRRSLGDAIEQAMQRQTADLTALRNAAAQAQSATAQAPPKKIIVDNSAPATTAKKHAVHKKKPAKAPAAAPPQ